MACSLLIWVAVAEYFGPAGIANAAVSVSEGVHARFTERLPAVHAAHLSTTALRQTTPQRGCLN